jgi:hypothetical protein
MIAARTFQTSARGSTVPCFDVHRAGGSPEISRWWSEPKRAQPPVSIIQRTAPRRVREKHPIHTALPSPQIPLVVFHHAALQHRQVFLLKRLHTMMLGLVQDIRSHRINVGRADREGSVSLLPFKSRQVNLSMNPFRRFASDPSHYIGKAMGGTKTHENVDMISYATNGMSNAAQTSDRAADVFMDAANHRIGKPRFTILGAEDNVVMQREMSRGRESHFSRSCRSAIHLAERSGGCARLGSLHHRLISFEPPARQKITILSLGKLHRARILPHPFGQAHSRPGPLVLSRMFDGIHNHERPVRQHLGLKVQPIACLRRKIVRDRCGYSNNASILVSHPSAASPRSHQKQSPSLHYSTIP